MTGKNSGFRIRVERELRDTFVEICRVQDRPAAQVIRAFMRQYIAENSKSAPSLKGHDVTEKTGPEEN